jgi:predicted ATPase
VSPASASRGWVEAFLEHVDLRKAEIIRLQCSPYHTNSSLYPVVERLRRLAGFAPNDGPGERLSKLEHLVATAHDDIPAVLLLFAELLSVDVGAACPKVDLPPTELRERFLDLLVARLIRLATRALVVLILEDAHWVDPTTQ